MAKISKMSFKRFCLSALKVYHCHPTQEFNIYCYVYRNVWLCFECIIASLTFMSYIRPAGMGHENMKITTNLVLTWFHTVPKVTLFILRKSDLAKMYDDVKMFWSIEECELSDNDLRKIKADYNFMIGHIKTFIYSVVVLHVPLIYTIYVIFDPRFDVTVPYLANKYPKSKVIFQTLVAINSINVCAILAAFDWFLIYLSAEANSQFQALGHRIKFILSKRDGNVQEELGKCIKYHDFLLSFIKRLASVCRTYYLFIFLNGLYSMGSQMVLFVNVTDTKDMIFNLGYYCGLLLQYSIYCFTCSKLSDEVAEIAGRVYDSNWYRQSVTVQKMVVVVLIRSQRAFAFTAGGLLNIDRRNFTEVFKTTLSILTIARVLNEKALEGDV